MDGEISESLRALDKRWGRAGAVRFEDRYGGPVAVLTSSEGTAVVALQGAQVLSYRPIGGSNVLWLSPVAQLGTGKAVRGGIPICWPWFGPHPQDPKKPAHGFVRAAQWDVAGTAGRAGQANIRFSFDARKVDPARWEHAAVVTVDIVVSDVLEIMLTTTNRGTDAIPLTQALHTYLAIGDAAEISIEGLDGRAYIDQLAPGQRPLQKGPITITGEVDRIYQQAPDTVVVHDKKLKRKIRVAKKGSASTVVWNPGAEKATRLGDMGPDGYRQMVCVETANAGDDVVTLAPGKRHQLVARILAVPA